MDRAIWATAGVVLIAVASCQAAYADVDSADPRNPAALRAERRGDIVCAAMSGATCGATGAAPCAQPCDPCGKRWRFEATIPIWIPGVTGTMATGGSSVTGGGFDKLPDVVADLEFAFLGRFHAEHGRWSGTVDGFGVTLDTAFESQASSGESGESSAVILRGDVGYRLLDRGNECSCSSFVLDAYAGARYYAVDVDIATRLGHLKASRDWTDPIVGLRTVWQITPRWSIHAEADVGGFGVGSDLAIWASAAARYRISRLISVEAGWTVLDCEFEKGSFEWNLTLSGPRLGLTFHF